MTTTASGERGWHVVLAPDKFKGSLTAAEVLALVRSGELPAIRLGSIGQWRGEHAVLESFITDKYDESRRLALWHEAEYADVAEIFPDQRRSRST